MTEKSMLWTAAAGSGDGAAAYTEAETTRLFRRLVTGTDNEGVLPDPDEEFGASGSNELAVSGTATPLDVEAGDAWCHGYYYWSTAQENVAIGTPSGATRIDRVVLRVTFADDEVRITLIAGTEGSGTPPALTQNATYWDIPLAQVSITTGGVCTVTDEREYVHFNTKINTAMIDDDAITAAKIASGAVDSSEIATGAVDTAELAADAVTNAKIADDQIDSEHYVDGSIDTAHLANEAVTAAKIDNRTRRFLLHGAVGYDWTGGSRITAGDPRGVTMQDSENNEVYFGFLVPEDFASGLSVSVVVYPNSSGNIYSQIVANYGADGQAYNVHSNSIGLAAVAVTSGQHNDIQSLSLASAAKNDFVLVTFKRDATNAADTINDVVNCVGLLVEYTADG